MTFDNEFVARLKAELQQPLPGEKVQYRMAPPYRPNLTREEIAAYNPKVSGVMLLLYDKADTLHMAFTQRRKYEGVHSGQMSFPGGKKDEGDIDLTDTAFRETEEEIGIARNQIELLGTLSELYIPPSNFLVSPSVGFCQSITPFIPQKSEVEKVVEIPVGFFLDKQNINPQTEIKLFNNHVVKVPAYIFEGHVIWGATAIILSEFTWIVEQVINRK